MTSGKLSEETVKRLPVPTKGNRVTYFAGAMIQGAKAPRGFGVRVTAAGVTPLDHTILSGGHPRAKAPLVLGNEGAGIIEDAGDSGFPAGSPVMFTGPYGVRENGAWQELLLARPEDLAARRNRRRRRG